MNIPKTQIDMFIIKKMEITQYLLSVWNLRSVQMLRSNKKEQFMFTYGAKTIVTLKGILQAGARHKYI